MICAQLEEPPTDPKEYAAYRAEYHRLRAMGDIRQAANTQASDDFVGFPSCTLLAADLMAVWTGPAFQRCCVESRGRCIANEEMCDCDCDLWMSCSWLILVSRCGASLVILDFISFAAP
jgi:hypothetical protein